MNTYIKQWFPLLLLLLVGTGCADEQLISGSNLVAGKTVKVDLNLKIPQAEVPIAPATRSADSGAAFSVALQPSENIETRSDGNTPLYNLWLFQFDESGTALVRKQISTTDVPVNDMVTLSVDLVVGSNQTLYIVVLGEALTSDLTEVSTLAELESYPFEYISTKEGVSFSLITEDKDIPFAGKTEGVEVFALGDDGRGFVQYNSPSGFTGGVEIKRLMAKIEMTCDYNTADFALTGAQLDNVANAFVVNPDNTSSAAFRYESLRPDMVADGTADAYKHTFTWYVAPNMKGTVDAVATEQDRHKGNKAVPANATRIYFWANKNSTNDYCVYEVYVGKNATSNFDVAANNLYRMSTKMDVAPGSINDDGRVVYPNVFTPNVELFSFEKGEIYDLDAHYDFRPLTIDGFGQTFKVEILNADGSPANENDSWLKVSSASDYTNAKRNNDLNLTTSAKIILPIPLHFYIYADEYVVPNAPKRSMKVRVTASGLNGGGTSTPTVFTLQQRSIVNVGYWGGKLGGDGWSLLLGMEQIEEHLQVYKTYSVTPIVKGGRPWGYYGVDTGLKNGPTSGGGKYNTKILAENPSNWPITVLSSSSTNSYDIQPIKNLDGSPLLSQYTYYNSYAARYCYDKNRDENGNGQIDSDELKWYLPTTIQLEGIWIQSEDRLGYNWISSIEKSSYDNSGMDMKDGAYHGWNKKSLFTVRCVRDIDKTN